MPLRPSKRFNLDRLIVLVDPGEPVKSGLELTYPNAVQRETMAEEVVADDKEDIRDDIQSTTQRKRLVVRWRPPGTQGFPPTTKWHLLDNPTRADEASPWEGDRWEVKSAVEIQRREWIEILAERTAQ